MEDQRKVTFTGTQADMMILVIGVLAQMDMVGRQRGMPVGYKNTVAKLVGDLTAVFGLDFVQNCQRMMQGAASTPEKIVVTGPRNTNGTH